MRASSRRRRRAATAVISRASPRRHHVVLRHDGPAAGLSLALLPRGPRQGPRGRARGRGRRRRSPAGNARRDRRGARAREPGPATVPHAPRRTRRRAQEAPPRRARRRRRRRRRPAAQQRRRGHGRPRRGGLHARRGKRVGEAPPLVRSPERAPPRAVPAARGPSAGDVREDRPPNPAVASRVATPAPVHREDEKSAGNEAAETPGSAAVHERVPREEESAPPPDAADDDDRPGPIPAPLERGPSHRRSRSRRKRREASPAVPASPPATATTTTTTATTR